MHIAASPHLSTVREVGPSGDDYTSLLGIPAGITLMGVGFAALCQMRRVIEFLDWALPDGN